MKFKLEKLMCLVVTDNVTVWSNILLYLLMSASLFLSALSAQMVYVKNLDYVVMGIWICMLIKEVALLIQSERV